MSEDESINTMIDEIYSEPPGSRIKLFRPNNLEEEMKPEYKITGQPMEKRTALIEVMRLSEPEGGQHQTSHLQMSSAQQTTPEQSRVDRFEPRRMLEQSTRIAEHYETLTPTDLKPSNNLQKEENIGFGSLVENINKKLFFGENSASFSGYQSSEPTTPGRLNVGTNVEPQKIQFSRESSLIPVPVPNRFQHSENLNPRGVDLIQPFNTLASNSMENSSPVFKTQNPSQTRYEEDFFHGNKNSDSLNPDFVFTDKTAAPVYPTSTYGPVYPTRTDAPIYPTSSEAPIYPTSSEAPIYFTRTDAPFYPTSYESSIYSTRTDTPIYPTSSEAPIFPTRTDASIYPTSSEAPIYPTSYEAPIYPTSTDAPLYPTSTNYPTRSYGAVYPSQMEVRIKPMLFNYFIVKFLNNEHECVYDIFCLRFYTIKIVSRILSFLAFSSPTLIMMKPGILFFSTQLGFLLLELLRVQ